MKSNDTTRTVQFLAIILAMAATSASAQYYWTGAGSDANWTTADNWTGAGYPSTTSHDAAFTNNLSITVDVDQDVTISYLYPRQAGEVTNTYTIADGQIFAPIYRHGFIEAVTNTVVIQGGTFKPRNDLTIAGKNTTGGAMWTRPKLVLTNTVFDLDNLTSGIQLGYNTHSEGSIVGELDARGAEIRYNGAPHTLSVANLWLGYNHRYGVDAGRLWLPPSVTNIAVTSFRMRGTSSARGDLDGWLDLGDQPQLQTLTIGSEAAIGRGYIIYRDGSGNQQTNLPPNVVLKIGTSDAPAVFNFGVMYNTTLSLRWSGFRRFEGYFSEINIGRSDNTGTAYAELDLSEVAELAGDFTAVSVETPILRMGGGDRIGTGVLKLPGTVTNLTFDTFHLGNVTALYQPANSILHLGSNSQLRAITVKDEFIIGRGRFEYMDAGGTPRTDLPGNVAFRAGAQDRRAGLRVGNCLRDAIESLFGPGLATFEAWLTELRVASYSTGYPDQSTTETLDLRGVEVKEFDVEGTATIGIKCSDQATLYLETATMRCADLAVGAAANATAARNKQSSLNLSNAVVTVTNSVTLGQTGKVTATLNGSSAGLDLLTTNLVVAAEHATHTQWRGWLDLTFTSDPLNLAEDYFGLRLKGDAVASLQALTSAVPARLTWNIDGLSERTKKRFGIHYDTAKDRTIVGVPKRLSGTIFCIR